MRGKQYSPPEISAMVLQKLKKAAEDYLGEKVTEAVITVPAYFNDAQRQATKDAGKIAGLEVKRIVNEPTAAALAYGLDKKKDEKIAVYDFGGGTFDISILEVGDNVVEVISTNGDTHLGGDDFDHRIIDWLIAEFKKDTGIDLSKDKMVPAAPEGGGGEGEDRALERAWRPRSTCRSSRPTPRVRSTCNLKLTRAKFEQLDRGSRRAHDGARARRRSRTPEVKPSEIDEVVLVGGSTRIPLVQETVKEFFGKEPNKGVNPDEVVAVGAAVQGGVLSGDVKDMLLLDVTPLSLGVETLGGVMTVLIERNTTIPTRRRRLLDGGDNQTSVEIHVLQGERERRADNRTLGKFHLEGHPAGAARACRRSRSRSTSTPTASSTSREGQGHRQGAEDHHHRRTRPQRRRTRSRYTIVIQSHVPARLEVVVSVDGLDVLDGKSASVAKRGYLIDPHGVLEIDGFRQSMDAVAAFRFGSVQDSYAEKKHGDARNVGVIGVALFNEKGTNPASWPIGDAQNRLNADPFPGKFATPP
jgi:hypothetical protein